jgi:endoglucanase
MKNNKVKVKFRTTVEWDQGFTGKLDITNNGNYLKQWELEFNAPFEITDIWDAKIVSHKGNKYVLKDFGLTDNIAKGKTRSITFNANKIDGKVVKPTHYSFNGQRLSNSGGSGGVKPDTEELVDFDFRVSTEWDQGFTGKLDITNNGNNLKEWELEFNAPFEITNIWDAEIVSHKGNKYVIRDFGLTDNIAKGETRTVTFNANKINGKIVEPTNLVFDDSIDGSGNGGSGGNGGGVTNPQPGKGQFRYGEALQKTFLFYEAQRSGDLPADNRIEWRGDSALKDGSDVGRDLTGGYYDAGDHVKFGQPMAATISMISWGVVEFEDAYKKMGQKDDVLDAIKWGTDYFLKAHVSEGGKTKELYVQVGDGKADHAYWGSPEKMTMARPSFKINAQNPGTDVAADTAAALALSSMAFKGTDDAYARTLIQNAEQLFKFAETYKGKYSDSVPAANPYYTSWSGYGDELAYGAASLYKATGKQEYLDKAEKYFDQNNPYGLFDWTFAGDDKSYGAAVMLAQHSDDPKYKQISEKWLDDWIKGVHGIKYTSGGLAWRNSWASLSLSSGTAFMAGVYNDSVRADAKYDKFVREQVDYILGDNPRNASYMVGFGKNYPQRPHHRSSSGNAGDSQPNQHILYGALVGGPGSVNDFDYNDSRGDWVTNEVATGYNAPLTGALAYMYDNYGGDPLTEKELDMLPGVDVDGV